MTVPAFFMPITYLALVKKFPNGTGSQSRIFWVFHGFCITYFVVSLFSDNFISSATMIDSQLNFTFGWIYNLENIYIGGSILFGNGILLKKYIKLSDTEQRNQIQLVWVGTLLSVLNGLIFGAVLPVFGLPQFNFFAPIGTLIFVAFWATAILKYRLMDISVVVKKTPSYIATIGIAFMSAGLVGFIVRTYIPVIQADAVLVGVCAFWAGAGEYLRNFLITTVKHTFFKGNYNPEASVDMITQELNNATESSQVFTALANILDQTLLSSSVYTITRGFGDDSDRPYRFTHAVLQDPSKPPDPPVDIPATSDWIRYFESETSPILIKRLPKKIQFQLPASVNEDGIVLPCVSIRGLEGLIIVNEKDAGGSYRDEDIGFLKIVQNVAMISFDRHQKAQIAAEVVSAKRFQEKLVPHKKVFQDIEIEFSFKPFIEVSGDFIHIDELSNSTRVIVGDVTGHGLAAALGAFIVEALITSTYTNRENPSPLDLIDRVNSTSFLLQKRHKGGVGLTMVVFDIFADGRVQCAGNHDDALIYRHKDKKCVVQSTGSGTTPLGLIDSRDLFSLNEFHLEKGDILFVCTDGITEGYQAGKRESVETQFGLGQVDAILTTNPLMPLSEIRDLIRKSHDQWTNGRTLDDVTFVLIKLR